MLNILLGAPGGGKSYEAVVYHVLPALRAGRKVITNLPLVLEQFGALDAFWPGLIELRKEPALVRGTFDAEREVMFQLEGEPSEWRKASGRVFANVWDYWSDWKHPVTGNGPLIIIDECHLPLPRGRTDPIVSEWFSKHRHFNMDVLLITQSHGKMDTDVKESVQNVYKVRKAIALGRDDKYFRRVMDGVRGSLIEETERSYKPQFFKLYRSHTQGNSVDEEAAQDVKPFYVKFMRFAKAFYVLTFLIVVAVVWQISQKGFLPTSKVAVAPAKVPASGQLPEWAVKAGVKPIPPPVAVKAVEVASAPKPDEPPEPYGQKGLHLVGKLQGKRADGSVMNMFVMVMSTNGQAQATVTSVDLEKAGYKYTELTDCVGLLTWRGRQRSVICDSPQMALSSGTGVTGNTQPRAEVDPGPGAGNFTPAAAAKPQPVTVAADAHPRPGPVQVKR